MEFDEQPYHYWSEVSNEPNDNTANIIFLSQSRFESFGLTTQAPTIDVPKRQGSESKCLEVVCTVLTAKHSNLRASKSNKSITTHGWPPNGWARETPL